MIFVVTDDCVMTTILLLDISAAQLEKIKCCIKISAQQTANSDGHNCAPH